MGRFWVDDSFVREKARTLSIHAVGVYVSLSSHANGHGRTFIGQRLIAEELGIGKDTVTKAMKELEVSGLVRRLERGRGQVSDIELVGVRNEGVGVSAPVGHKEVFKEDIKEEIFKIEAATARGTFSPAKEALRARFGRR